MKTGMILRTALLIVWLGTALSFGAAAQTIKMGETAVPVDGTTEILNKGEVIVAQEVTLSRSATINSMSFYATYSGDFVLGVYGATGPSGGPGSLVAKTASFKSKVGWNVVPTTATPVLPEGNYWLAYLPSGNSLTYAKKFDTGNCRTYETYGTTLPQTFYTRPANCSPGSWSLYATLTPSTSGTSGASILPSASNASANWKMAGMQSVGGIPKRTTVCATLTSGGADNSVAINNAIASCPAGEVLMLAAGTFTIAEGNSVLIDKGITLRGAGPGTTILTRTGGATLGSYTPGSNPSPMVILGPQQYNNNQTATALTADGEDGSDSVQVKSTSGFAVGQIVQIDEASGAGWRPDVEGLGEIWAASDYRVVWQKHNPSQGFDDFSASQYPYQTGTAGCWFSNCDRPTTEYHKITQISGNTITFDSPLTISYRVSHQAQLYYFQTPFTENAGIEELTVEHGDDDNIDFLWCAYCWAYNVETTLWLGAGFGVDNSFRVELNEFYTHKPVWPVPGGGGYNISLANGSSEILIWNGISVLGNKVMVSRASGAGSVTAYNYMDMGFISGTDAWQEVGLNNSHMVGSHHMLFEGNYSFNTDSDQTHGNAIYNTFFRNYTTGFRAKFTDYLNNVVVNDIAQRSTNGPFRAASVHAYGYWDSFIGNVFGVPNEMGGFIYGDANEGAGNWPPQIYLMGWDDLPNQIYDPAVISTVLIDGNYDFVTDRVVWAASDTAHTLPNSLFLTQKPAFFNPGSEYPWPWVNPTGVPVFYTLPAKARYDAGTPFVQP